MQNITVKIIKGRQLKANLRPGIQGTKGADGLHGEQGIQGIQGIKGDKGETGNSGVVFAEHPLEYNSETKTVKVSEGYTIPSDNQINTWNNKSNFSENYLDLNGIPSVFTPSVHTQDISTINELTDELNGKANINGNSAQDFSAKKFDTSETGLLSISGAAKGIVKITDNNTSWINSLADISFHSKISSNGTNALARIAAQFTGSGSYIYFGTSTSYSAGINQANTYIAPNGKFYAPDLYFNNISVNNFYADYNNKVNQDLRISASPVFKSLKLSGLSTFSSSDPSNLLNMWAKIAHIETGAGNNNYGAMKLILAAGGMAHVRYDTAIIDFVVKRQLGSVSGSGAVLLKLSNNNAIKKENFIAVLTQDDANNSIVDLYIQFTTSWTIYNFSPLVAMGGASVINAIDAGGAIASPPTGIAQYSCSYYDAEVQSLNVENSLSINGLAGATGSFVTADGKTVTVKSGLITSII